MAVASIKIVNVQQEEDFNLNPQDSIIKVAIEEDGTITLVVLQFISKG